MPLDLPANGRTWSEIREEMVAMRDHDLDWRNGRHGAYVWYASDDLEDVLREAFGMYMVENGLGIRVFPSIGRMEREVLSIVHGLLSGDDETSSVFTSGGTESIFVAIYAAREWARANRAGIVRPEIVAPHSAHPALNKAAHLLGLTVKRVARRPGLPRRPRRHRSGPHAEHESVSMPRPRLIRSDSSTPSRPSARSPKPTTSGSMSTPASAASSPRLCAGRLFRPALRLRRPRRDLDLGRSPQVGLHRQTRFDGQLPHESLRDFARYRFDDWPSGTYMSHTFTGTRPGGAIAAAWAGMQFLGKDGYRRIAESSMRAKNAIAEGVSAIPGVTVFGKPDLWAFAFGAPDVDMPGVAALMGKRGWVCGATTSPSGIHVMASPVHEPIAGEYVAAIRECIEEARAAGHAPAAAAAYN